MPVIDAAIEAAQLRLRPILMTSFAFILDVVPLFFASGAGGAAGAGDCCYRGMLTAKLLAVFIVPVLLTVMERSTERRGERSAAGATPVPAPAECGQQ